MEESEKTTGRLESHIFLVGFMGTGKSTVSESLSKLLGVRRLEMDQMIEEEQQTAISRIFEAYGENYFRDLETELLISLEGEQPAVISCGGGVAVRPENISHMKKNGRIVWLTARPETVYERVKDSRERPVLNGNMNEEFIGRLMEKRREQYEAAADLTVETDGKTAPEIAKEIISKLSGGKKERMEDAI